MGLQGQPEFGMKSGISSKAFALHTDWLKGGATRAQKGGFLLVSR